MANERKTVVTYQGDGSQKSFAFPFDYLRKSFVKAMLDGVEQTYGIDYTVNGKQLDFAVAPAENVVIVIYRETTTDRLVAWEDASVLRATDMTLFEVQLLHIAEETQDKVQDSGMARDDYDGVWDGRLTRIKNVLDPVYALDVVNKQYFDAFKGKLSDAQASATVAKTSETNAKVSETNAKTSETNAKASEINAKTSETNAKVSEINAKTSETNAKVSETNAKTSETNAKASEINAKTSENLVTGFTNFSGIAKLMAYITKRPVADVRAFGAVGDGVVDDTAAIQDAIDYVMNLGGGKVIFPADDTCGVYRIDGTLYTHSTALSSTKRSSPLTLEGFTNGSLAINSTYKYGAILLKENTGTILAVNHNLSNTWVTKNESIRWYSGLKIMNLLFKGKGTVHPKWPTLASTNGGIGIKMHQTRIHIEDCGFYALDYGIYQPSTVDSETNYCDYSIYRNLTMNGIGIGGMNIVTGDGTIVEKISISPAITGQYGIKVGYNGSGLSISNCLMAGKNFLLNTTFIPILLESCHNTKIRDLYFENLNTPAIQASYSQNIDIDGVYIRHYKKQIFKGDTCRNVTLNNLRTLCEENRELDLDNDPGDYSVYKNCTPSPDIELTNCYNIKHDNTLFYEGTHSGWDINESGVRRFVPRINNVNNSSRLVEGRMVNLFVIGDSSGNILAYNGGLNVEWVNHLKLSAPPTFDTTTGKLTFPNDGFLANGVSFCQVTPHINEYTTCRPYTSSLSPLVISLRTAGENVMTDPKMISFHMTIIL